MASREFGALLTKARRDARLTQTELAVRMGMDRGQLASYESGARDPGATQLLRIARALDRDVLGEAVPRDEPPWVEDIRERLERIEAVVTGREAAYRRTGIGDDREEASGAG